MTSLPLVVPKLTDNRLTARMSSPLSPKDQKLDAVWITLAIFIFILILLIFFILQNSITVQIHYFGAKGTLQFGIAMLIATVAGSLLTLLVGSARIIQLKTRRKRT